LAQSCGQGEKPVMIASIFFDAMPSTGQKAALTGVSAFA
jgi:hypothetical protein